MTTWNEVCRDDNNPSEQPKTRQDEKSIRFKGKGDPVPSPVFNARGGLTLAKPDSIVPYGTSESKDRPKSDFEKLYLALSPARGETALIESDSVRS